MIDLLCRKGKKHMKSELYSGGSGKKGSRFFKRYIRIELS